MRTYLVGGAVRDELLGRECRDRDYVVVGANTQQMLAAGFTQIGKDFPVFLHPQTHEEYALARVERKTGAGHGGFAVSTENVTLEEDLGRRDLTINSMALAADGTLVDPYGGLADLQGHTLRHTTAAFEEDPLRVLRIARFLARFGPDWGVHPQTTEMVLRMVRGGALNELPFERIWKELERGLMEPHPALMVTAMLAWEVPQQAQCMAGITGVRPGYQLALGLAAEQGAVLAVRFAAAFTVEARKTPSALPREVTELAVSVQAAEEHGARGYSQLDAAQRLGILERLDVIRRPQRLELVLQAMQLIEPFDDQRLRNEAATLAAMDRGAIAAACGQGVDIRQRIQAASLAAIA